MLQLNIYEWKIKWNISWNVYVKIFVYSERVTSSLHKVNQSDEWEVSIITAKFWAHNRNFKPDNHWELN